MHENREISSTPWSDDQGRSAKATSRKADMHVPDKGKGGKYLFLPPGYTGTVPEGYFVFNGTCRVVSTSLAADIEAFD
jgi:hypothetical protein